MFKDFHWFKINQVFHVKALNYFCHSVRSEMSVTFSLRNISCCTMLVLINLAGPLFARSINGQTNFLLPQLSQSFKTNRSANANYPAIRLNQIGFYPESGKYAIITGRSESESFYIINARANDTVYRGKLGKLRTSLNSSTTARTADFSTLQTVGNYLVAVPGIKNSGIFKIKNSVYHDLAIASLKAFYFQRASMPLLASYAGKWARAKGHPDTAVLIHSSAATLLRPEGIQISSSRGWYDAGDYNKYIVNSGISTSTLLSAYEDHSTYFKPLSTNIPESNNTIPDILDEAIYNLRWMLTMQDPTDGGVYHKCTNAVFDKMVMPAQALMPRYVVQKGTAATLDFAAVTAQAARILKSYKKELPGLADSCLKSSLKAWAWANKFPDQKYDQTAMNMLYHPKILTGDYGDKNFNDEFFWAAAELFATTSQHEFYDALVKGLDREATVPSWSNVQVLGYYALLHPDISLPAYSVNSVFLLKNRLTRLADSLLEHIDQNVFLSVLGKSRNDFGWGSNSLAANQSILLLYAFKSSGENKYIRYSLVNLDYILGQNATGYCFVTGFGVNSPLHPHHRPSISDGVADPVPGLLVGGPNPGRQDGQKYPFSEPETAYTDNDAAYACNEIAINWNAPLVYLVNAVEDYQLTKPFLIK